MTHEQLDLTGGSIPLEELNLAGHSRRLAQAERERGHSLNAVEAGQLVHSARGKHTVDEVCTFCGEDGTQALLTLGAHRSRIAERARRAAQDPPWTCVDCQHMNPPEADFCRSCASAQAVDREPDVGVPEPVVEPGRQQGSGDDPEPDPTRLQPGREGL